MGNKQSATSNWSVDDWAFGTGENTVSIEEVVDEAGKMPAKYFGGKVVENDPSMHQMQNDLLSFDNTLKNFFRRIKSKRSKTNNESNEYYDQDQQSILFSQSSNSVIDQNYRQPMYTNENVLPPLMPMNDPPNNIGTNADKAIWRCSNCTVENKTTERACRRCGQPGPWF